MNDGTKTNEYVPIYGYYADDISKSQFIIPASALADMAWGTISKMTFYAQADKNWGAAQFEVYMTETSETTLSSLADYGTMTKVKNAGSLSISGNVMEVTLDDPYQYMGGNLMIGFLRRFLVLIVAANGTAFLPRVLPWAAIITVSTSRTSSPRPPSPTSLLTPTARSPRTSRLPM